MESSRRRMAKIRFLSRNWAKIGGTRQSRPQKCRRKDQNNKRPRILFLAQKEVQKTIRKLAGAAHVCDLWAHFDLQDDKGARGFVKEIKTDRKKWRKIETKAKSADGPKTYHYVLTLRRTLANHMYDERTWEVNMALLVEVGTKPQGLTHARTGLRRRHSKGILLSSRSKRASFLLTWSPFGSCQAIWKDSQKSYVPSSFPLLVPYCCPLLSFGTTNWLYWRCSRWLAWNGFTPD